MTKLEKKLRNKIRLCLALPIAQDAARKKSCLRNEGDNTGCESTLSDLKPPVPVMVKKFYLFIFCEFTYTFYYMHRSS